MKTLITFFFYYLGLFLMLAITVDPYKYSSCEIYIKIYLSLAMIYFAVCLFLLMTNKLKKGHEFIGKILFMGMIPMTTLFLEDREFALLLFGGIGFVFYIFSSFLNIFTNNEMPPSQHEVKIEQKPIVIESNILKNEEVVKTKVESIDNRNRIVCPSINNSALKNKIDILNSKVDQILNEAKGDTANKDDIRRLKEYYLPTIEKSLRTYAKLEKASSSTEVIKTKKEIEDFVDQTIDVMDKLYAKLLEDDSLDIRAEIQAIKNVMKSNVGE